MKRPNYTITPLEDNSKGNCLRWGIRVSCGHDPATGKRIRPYETFDGTEREAHLRAMTIKVEHGIIESTNMTVAEYFSGMYLPWVKNRVRKESYTGGPRDRHVISRETYRGYEQTASNYVIPLFGHLGLADLKAYFVETKLAGIEHLGARRNVYKLLRQGYRRAVKWQLVNFVITDAVDEPKPEKADKPTVKSVDMWDYIDAFEGEDVLPAVVIGFAVGLRRSEIVAIDREEIDWTADTDAYYGSVTIWRSYHWRNKVGWFEPPKSFTSARTVFLPRWAGEIIHGFADGTGPLLVRNGERMRPGHVTRRWKEIIVQKKLPVTMPFKNTRHSCGTMLVREDGLPISDVQQLLGHSTPIVTSEFYVQKGTESVERAAAAMNRRARIVRDCPSPLKSEQEPPKAKAGDSQETPDEQ